MRNKIILGFCLTVLSAVSNAKMAYLLQVVMARQR